MKSKGKLALRAHASMAPRGRPPKYKAEYPAQAEKLCRLGATDIEIADFFGVDVATIKRWKASHEDFCAALKSGKEQADERVERSLYHKACGYTYDAVKIMQYEGDPVIVPYREHVPPDTTACIFWLKNRRPDLWRDKTDHNHSHVHDLDRLTDDQLHRIARRGLKERPPGNGRSNDPQAGEGSGQLH